jgi:hypothetical protein
MPAGRSSPPSTRFLNVDLDICSKSDLQPLIAALGKKVVVLHAGREKRTYCAHLELARRTNDADATIRLFCALIGSLKGTERTLWNTAKVRDFNIGVQAAARPFSYDIALANDTVKSAAAVGARIVFTVYAPEKHPRPSAKLEPVAKKRSRPPRVP